LAEGLKQIRKNAFLWLHQNKSDIPFKIEEIRTNVFIPDYTRSDGDLCFLFIPEKLQVGMDGGPDFKIRFRPL